MGVSGMGGRHVIGWMEALGEVGIWRVCSWLR